MVFFKRLAKVLKRKLLENFEILRISNNIILQRFVQSEITFKNGKIDKSQDTKKVFVLYEASNRFEWIEHANTDNNLNNLRKKYIFNLYKNG